MERVEGVGQLFGVDGRVGQVGERTVEVLAAERRSCMHFPEWGVRSALECACGNEGECDVVAAVWVG